MAKKKMTLKQKIEKYEEVMAPVMARLAGDWMEDFIKRHDLTARVMSTRCRPYLLVALDDGVYGTIEMTVKAGQADEQSIKLVCGLDGESRFKVIDVLSRLEGDYRRPEEVLVSVLIMDQEEAQQDEAIEEKSREDEDMKESESKNAEERDTEGIVIRFEDRVMEIVGMKHNPRTGEIGFTWDADGFPYIVEFGMKMDEDGSFDLRTANVDITFDEFVAGFREWYGDNEDCYAEDDEIMYRVDGGEWVVLRDWEMVHSVRRKDASFEYHEEFSEDNLNAMDEDDRNSFLCDMADGCTSYPLAQDYPEDELVYRYSSIDWGYAGKIKRAYTCAAACLDDAKDFMERVYGEWSFHLEDEEHMRPEDRGFAGIVRYLAYTDSEDLTCDWVWDDRCFESYDEATACAKSLLEDEDVERAYVSVMLYWGGDEDQWQEDTCYTYTVDEEE